VARIMKNPPASSPWDSEVRLLAWLATCVSVFSFLFYFQRSDVLLYGDAVAHINIARRVFDSKTPGLLQLGTVWLPLPHLLMIPFLVSKEMWRRGVGGSIPSMVAYVFGATGIFRLVRGALSRGTGTDRAASAAAWTAAIVYAANPNLIYMQTTAMSESLYLALFLWAIAHLSEFVRGSVHALMKCGMCLAAACLTRYDGWFLAGATVVLIVLLHLLPGNDHSEKRSALPFNRAAMVRFILVTAAGPLLWLTYNAIVYRNPLEFANGPYSAKAIERRTQSVNHSGHPGSGDPVLASRYFLKSAELNVAENEWLQRTWILLAVAALVVAAWTSEKQHIASLAWLLVLYVPVPFYALSVAYGGVPIFIPPWWPFTHYNVRYGLQLLPAFAASMAVLVYVVLQRNTLKPRTRMVVLFALFAFLIVSYGSIWRATPSCLEEAQINMRTRNQLETQLAAWLQKLPPESTLLMYVGDHVGALQRAGIPLKQTINEGNHRTWKQPVDQDGLWERALADPARYADYIIAFEGDRVWQAIQGRHYPALVVIHVTGQAQATVYRAR
jgi:hypothetical protein